MSLFKERQAGAKKVVELQNKVLSLQMELENALKKTKKKPKCNKCDDLNKQLLVSKEDLDAFGLEIKELKQELKKSRTEATRALNKLSALEHEENV